MTEKKRKPRPPKIQYLPDGSMIIEGFIAPAPKLAKPEPHTFPPEYEYAPIMDAQLAIKGRLPAPTFPGFPPDEFLLSNQRASLLDLTGEELTHRLRFFPDNEITTKEDKEWLKKQSKS